MTGIRERYQPLLGFLIGLLTVGLVVFFVAWLVWLGLSLPGWLAPSSVVAQGGATPAASTPAPATTPFPLTPVATPGPVTPHLIVNAEGVNVRSGPDTTYPGLGLLVWGEEVIATGRYADWWQIDYQGTAGWVRGDLVIAVNVAGVPEVIPPPPTPTPTPEPMDRFPPIFTPADPATVTEARWIDVDLSDQQVTVYEGQTPVRSYLVSTGLPQTPTPVGQFRIWVKLRYADMSGPGYDIKNVPFVMYFYRGYGLHGVTWHANFGHPMSHGCINLPNDEAEWLFNFADVGTLVNIHE